MSLNESSIYDTNKTDQITYEILFNEWLKNYIMNSSDEKIFKESLKSKFDELINMIGHENEPNFHSKTIVKNVAVIVCYSFIIFISLFGNLLVCYVILSKQRLRARTTNILIANLTISDLLMTTLNIPITTGIHFKTLILLPFLQLLATFDCCGLLSY
jgi:hypothetical protein